jgi:hypothetical protein
MKTNNNKLSSRTISTSISIYLIFLAVASQSSTSAFFLPSKPISFSLQNQHQYQHQHEIHKTEMERPTSHLLMSSIGDGNDNGKGGNGSSGSNNLDDWLDPRKASSESDNLKRARAQISEDSLPINFDISEEDADLDADVGSTENIDSIDNKNGISSADESGNEKETDNENADIDSDDANANSPDSVQDLIDQKEELTGKLDLLKANATTTNELMATNPYLQVVSKLSPSDLISKFTSTAHPRVQDAVRSTVLGLIGTLPKMAFETTTITTGERLASLMFQLQLTGYMLKNADYRLSLSQSLGMSSTTANGQSQFLLEGLLGEIDEDDEEGSLSEGQVKGKIKISYGKTNDDENDTDADTDTDGSGTEDKDGTGDEDDNDSDTSFASMEVEVDAAAYMAELRSEVAKLREDLVTTRKEKEDEIRKDLLLYIRTLPQKELKSLTGTLSGDVLNAMKGLVNVVMSGIGEGQIGPETVTEQSGEAMAQLCMWQLVVGYNLRELEVREEMKNILRSGSLDSDNEDSSDIDDDSDNSGDDNGDAEEGSIDFEKGGFE